MIDEKAFFLKGERRLGRYTVVILQHVNGDWMPALMQLDALISNYRLMLRPFRKKYAPATLPAAYIDTVELTRRSIHHCVGLGLVTGDFLFLLSATGQLEHLYEDLRLMKVPPPRFKWDDKVAREDIQRLINFFSTRE